MNRAQTLRAFGAFAGAYAVLGADAAPAKIVVGPGVSPVTTAQIRLPVNRIYRNKTYKYLTFYIAYGRDGQNRYSVTKMLTAAHMFF